MRLRFWARYLLGGCRVTGGTQLAQLTDQLRLTFGWALATVRATLPRAIREFGRSPDARLARLGPDNQLIPVGVRYRSWFGETCLGEGMAGAEPPELQLELPDSGQYRQVLKVSEGVARRGRAALELRLNEFSPLPVDQARFAFRQLAPPVGGRCEIEVAVIRASHLQQAIDALPGSAVRWSVVGAVDAAGEPGFRFAAGSAGRRRRGIGRGPGLLLIIAACVMVCIAWADRFSREAETLELRRTELIGFARSLRDAELGIELAERAMQGGAPNVPLDRVVEALRELGGRAPEDLTIRTVALEPPHSLVIEGPDPDTTDAATLTRLELPLGDES
ncbi:hypothetical protein [Maricaulis sp.]|uniref:hypothetical protein n=1 Tax=Maricaulis sp. TaxID=1486257 RepID=UPI003A95D0FD